MTKLEYMLDTYRFKSEATITEIWSNEFGNYIMLDTTIFYPQGGWQPTDIGIIKSENQKAEVINVRADVDGKVLHYIAWGHTLSDWDSVTLHIDEATRRFNARNHSAGHLLDVAVSNIWYNHLTPTRGHHFPEGSYVAYEGIIDAEQRETFIQKLQNEIDSLISQDIAMRIRHENLGDNEVPSKSTHRHANFEWYDWCGCWGTHITSSWEIWAIHIRKVSSKKWCVKISYQIK